MQGKIDIDDLTTHTLRPDRLIAGFELMRSSDSIRSVVLLRGVRMADGATHCAGLHERSRGVDSFAAVWRALRHR